MNPLRADHPVWMCSMRPFFLLAMVSAVGLLGLWSLALAAGLPPPIVAGGPLVWHAHELILGMGMAGVAGFALTALPEFTHTAGATRGQLRALVALWLCGRLGFWLSGWLGLPALLLAALGQVGLALLLVAVLWPAFISPDGRRHASFGWLALALAASSAGFYADALRGLPSLRWLYVSLGVLMLLVVVAASRISMNVVNAAIDEITPGADPYIARPPRRHMAALCITLYTGVEFFHPASALAGWLALAAGAAVFNLLNDWHVGAALWRKRWPLLLYAMYWCMALGYIGLGLGALDLLPAAASGRHMMAIGAMGLGIYIVVSIAGRAHAGYQPDPGPWLALGGALLLAAALVRAITPLAGGGLHWLALAGLLWCLAFAVLLWRVGPGLWLPRTDGRSGCEGPA